MGNLCSIFHSRFKNLITVIPSARKAHLLDYILLGWQTSNYQLKGSNKKWFMKPYAQIVDETGIPRSTLERYIKEFNEAGFIERQQALFSRTKEDGTFEVKKGTYISITDKLLVLLKPLATPAKVSTSKQNNNIHNDENKSQSENPSDQNSKKTGCSYFVKNEGTDSLKMRGLYIRDLYTSSFNNNIMFEKLNCSMDKTTLKRLVHQFETIQNLFDSEIKEEIPDKIKKLVLGTFFNLTFKDRKQFSSPKQLAAEYLFALVNVDFYLPKVGCFKHRNNIFSKMIRENSWRTPKGFYKHFYLGQLFKDKQELREERWEQDKAKEINNLYTIEDEHKDERLISIEVQINEKGTLLDELTKSIYWQSDEEDIALIREKMGILRKELENLYHQQGLIEQEIVQQQTLKIIKRCA